MQPKIRLAIQKSGRLNQDSIQILKDIGISINNNFDQLKVKASNFPLEVFFLRNSDIPQYLKDGVIDIAIIGHNLLVEKADDDIQIVERLGFSKCRVSIAVAQQFNYQNIQSLEGLQIATSYPNTVKEYFKKNNVNIGIHQISGSVEIAPNIGLANAVVDIVSSGSTLFKNNLKEVEVILKSEAVICASPKMPETSKELLAQLQFRIKSVLRAKKLKYITLNIPTAKVLSICKILPVMKSPTVMPLAEKDWSSIHTVIEEDLFWKVINQLKELGAEGILVLPIEKVVL